MNMQLSRKNPCTTTPARIAALQAKIAQSAARSDIEIYCDEVGERWYDLYALRDPEIAPTVAEAVEYLAGVGKLLRHPIHAHWERPIHMEGIGISGAGRYGGVVINDLVGRMLSDECPVSSPNP